MNNDFDFNENNNRKEEILMSEADKKHHKGIFSKLCFAFLAYLLIAEGLGFVIVYFLSQYAPDILQNNNFTILLSSGVQYLVSFPILYLIIRKMPAKAPEKSKLTAGRFLKYAFVSIFIMYVGNYISTMIMTYMDAFLGTVPENSVETVLTKTNIVLSILFVGIIGPIIEEFMFRKFFIDRLSLYGEAVAIFFPALMFGLFHGNLYQFFYAFFLGVAFSYIYVRTGKIIYSTALHIFINLFCGVLPSIVLGMFDYEEFMELSLTGAITEEYIMANALPIMLLGIYEFVMLAMVFVGIFMLTRNLRNIYFNKGEVRFPKGEGAEIMFFNPGTVIFIAVCLVVMALNTFLV